MAKLAPFFITGANAKIKVKEDFGNTMLEIKRFLPIAVGTQYLSYILSYR